MHSQVFAKNTLGTITLTMAAQVHGLRLLYVLQKVSHKFILCFEYKYIILADIDPEIYRKKDIPSYKT